MNALRLDFNWRCGVYDITLLRGHKKPVTTMACDGWLLLLLLLLLTIFVSEMYPF